MQLLAEGTSRRHTGETRSNAASSRSHCVFTAILESRHVEDGITSFRTARLHLVDLAGRLPDLTSFMSLHSPSCQEHSFQNHIACKQLHGV